MWQCQTRGYRNGEGAERCGNCGTSAEPVPAEAQAAQMPQMPQMPKLPQMPPGYVGQGVYFVPVPVPVSGQQELPATPEQHRIELWQYLLGCVIGAVPTVATWALFTISASGGTPGMLEHSGSPGPLNGFVALSASCGVFVLFLCVMAILLCIKRVQFVGFGILTAIFLVPMVVVGTQIGLDALVKAIGGH